MQKAMQQLLSECDLETARTRNAGNLFFKTNAQGTVFDLCNVHGGGEQRFHSDWQYRSLGVKRRGEVGLLQRFLLLELQEFQAARAIVTLALRLCSDKFDRGFYHVREHVLYHPAGQPKPEFFTRNGVEPDQNAILLNQIRGLQLVNLHALILVNCAKSACT